MHGPVGVPVTEGSDPEAASVPPAEVRGPEGIPGSGWAGPGCSPGNRHARHVSTMHATSSRGSWGTGADAESAHGGETAHGATAVVLETGHGEEEPGTKLWTCGSRLRVGASRGAGGAEAGCSWGVEAAAASDSRMVCRQAHTRPSCSTPSMPRCARPCRVSRQNCSSLPLARPGLPCKPIRFHAPTAFSSASMWCRMCAARGPPPLSSSSNMDCDQGGMQVKLRVRPGHRAGQGIGQVDTWVLLRVHGLALRTWNATKGHAHGVFLSRFHLQIAIVYHVLAPSMGITGLRGSGSNTGHRAGQGR